MRTLRITRRAQADLQEIWAYIAADNQAAASAFVEAITECFAPLLDHPELGPARDRLAPGLRVTFHRNYAIYYRFDARTVTIVRVLHGARDARVVLSERA